MKKQLLASLILATLSTSTFALPGKDQPPLIEVKATSDLETLSENGSERSQALRIAADGAERTPALRLAEGGAERLQRNAIAADGAERTPALHVAEDGAARTRALRTA